MIVLEDLIETVRFLPIELTMDFLIEKSIPIIDRNKFTNNKKNCFNELKQLLN